MHSSPEHVFARSSSADWAGLGSLLGGLALLGAAALGFAFALLFPVGTLNLHLMSTMPTILAVGLLAKWWSSRNSPQQVVVFAEGVALHRTSGVQAIRWTDIAWLQEGTAGMSQARQVTLYDAQGKPLAVIAGDVERYPELVALVRQHVSETKNPAVTAVKKKKSRMAAILSLVMGCLMLAGGPFLCFDSLHEARRIKLLEEQGVPGQAEIVRHFTAPNGRTRRIEYRVKSEGGKTVDRNVEVDPQVWAGLEGKSEVEVIHVPSDPAVSRLAVGEVEEDDAFKKPPLSYVMAGLCTLIGAGLLGAGIMQWFGWDLATDPQTGKVRLTRYGE
jgi:hypothetical protein